MRLFTVLLPGRRWGRLCGFLGSFPRKRESSLVRDADSARHPARHPVGAVRAPHRPYAKPAPLYPPPRKININNTLDFFQRGA